jgi:hypothetical protein
MGWVVREAECQRGDEERTFYNVEPTYGPQHEPHSDCWCEPDIDHEHDSLIIHREVH